MRPFFFFVFVTALLRSAAGCSVYDDASLAPPGGQGGGKGGAAGASDASGERGAGGVSGGIDVTADAIGEEDGSAAVDAGRDVGAESDDVDRDVDAEDDDVDRDVDADNDDVGTMDVGDDPGDDGGSNDAAEETGSVDVASDARDGGLDPTTAASVRIIATHSEKCMGVDGSGTADNTKILQFTCAAALGQIFRFESLGGAGYRIVNPSSGKCVSASGTGNGATLNINSCNGGATQSYTLQSAGANFSIVNTGAGNCVDVANQSTSDGAAYRFLMCNGSSQQVFRFEAP